MHGFYIKYISGCIQIWEMSKKEVCQKKKKKEENLSTCFK